MNALIYLIGTTVMFFAGYHLGIQQGYKDDETLRFNEGIRVTQKEVDQFI